MTAASGIIKQGATTTLFIDGFRDEKATPGTYLNAATATATLYDVTVPGTRTAIGAPITLLYLAASDGRYEEVLPHDFDSGALVDGMRIEVDYVAEEGVVHWEDTLRFRVET